MMWKPSFVVALLSLLVFSSIPHASEQENVFDTQGEKKFSQVKEENKAMNEAIKIYLDKNPPQVIAEFMYSTIEKAQPASIPEADRKKALSDIKKNVTPEILTKMISSGLKRNFTASEINVLAKNADSELSEDLKKKNDFFRYEVSSVIGLLLAATSGYGNS